MICLGLFIPALVQSPAQTIVLGNFNLQRFGADHLVQFEGENSQRVGSSDSAGAYDASGDDPVFHSPIDFP